MFCMRYGRLLVGYVEGELDERTHAKVERHLSRCAKCAEEVEMIRSVASAIRSAQTPEMEPAPDLWAKVSARIEREAAKPVGKPWIRVTQVASACAAVVFVGIVGMSLLHTDLPTETIRKSVVKVDRSRVETHTYNAKRALPGSEIAALGRTPGSAPEITRSARANFVPPRRYDKSKASVPANRITKNTPAPAIEPDRTRVGRPPVFTPDDETRVAREETVGTVSLSTRPGFSASAPTHSLSGVREYPDASVSAKAIARHMVSETTEASKASLHTEATEVVHVRVGEEDRVASVVDVLNETEGIRTAALFTYP